jgi:hypothetical protein
MQGAHVLEGDRADRGRRGPARDRMVGPVQRGVEDLPRLRQWRVTRAAGRDGKAVALRLETGGEIR